MRALTKSLIRANKPLGAAMSTSTTGTGLTTDQINKWLAGLLQPQARGNLLEQYGRSVPVYFGVKTRADAVARAPMKAYTISNTGELEWVGPNHEVQRHLRRMNPWWTHSDMWRAVETYLCLWGSSFRWIDKSAESVADWEQWVLRPDKVVVVTDRKAYIKGFIYDPHGAQFPMMPDEVIWDRYFNPTDEFSGLSPLETLWREIIPMRQDMIRTNRTLFQNGVLAQNIAFMLKGPLSSDQVERFYDRLEERHQGTANANRPLIVDLTSGNVENLGFSNREMEWMEGLKWAAGDILTALGVREELYPGSQRTTYHNLSEARQDFYRDTISSEWELIQSGMDERFRPMLPNRHQNLVFRFDTAVVGAMQESINEKSNRELNEVRAGTITPDEYRAERGRPPLPDGLGAKPYVSAGTLPLAGVGGQGSDAQTDPPRMLDTVRCPTCDGITGKSVLAGSGQYCRKCRVEFMAWKP